MFSGHNALTLELNHKKKIGRNSNTWKLKAILLKNVCVNQEIEELRQFIETNESENTSVQNLWDTAKAVLRGIYIAIQASLKKVEKSLKHKLTLHLKDLEKEEQIKPKPSRRIEIIKIRAESNEVETRKTVEQCNKTRSWFFKRIDKIDKPLAKLIQRKEKGPELKKS